MEATIEPDGQVRHLEPVELSEPQAALVTVLEKFADEASGDVMALLSEAARGADWSRPEEGTARAHWQPDGYFS